MHERGGCKFGWKSTPCQNLIQLIESINNLCSNVLHTIRYGPPKLGWWMGGSGG